MSESTTQQPQVITLDLNNSVQILVQFVEQAQKVGTFVLQESDILKRCKDLLINNVVDPELTVPNARQILIQAINKGQLKGAYSLDDASILFKISQYINANLTATATPTPTPEQLQQQADDDLSYLSSPVPLRTTPLTI